jgi:hypothetical protein
MKDGIPSAYWKFRDAWSAAHLAMIALLAIWLTAWLLNDGQGAQMFDDGYAWVEQLSSDLASLIPFPWDA